MKKLIFGMTLMGILVLGFGPEFTKEPLLVSSITKFKKMVMPKSAPPAKLSDAPVKTSENIQAEIEVIEKELRSLPTLKDIEPQFQTYPTEDLEVFLAKYEKDFDTLGLMGKAKNGTITLQERKTFAYYVTYMVTLRKLILERKITEIARHQL